METWKIIDEFPSYMVSTYGNVKSLKWGKEKILKQSEREGYKRVALYKDNKKITMSVHKLVAKTFIKNPNNKPYINHIDGNKSNNNITNLEWCNGSENTKHAMSIGIFKNNHNNIKIKCVETGEVFKNIKECSKEMNIDSSSISKVLLGKRQHAKNYTFKKVGGK